MKASAGTSRTPLPGMTPVCRANALRATTKGLDLHCTAAILRERGLRSVPYVVSQTKDLQRLFRWVLVREKGMWTLCTVLGVAST